VERVGGRCGCGMCWGCVWGVGGGGWGGVVGGGGGGGGGTVGSPGPRSVHHPVRLG